MGNDDEAWVKLDSDVFFPVPDELIEPDDQSALALARHIADHPLSTVRAAFGYFGLKIYFGTSPNEADEVDARKAQ